MAVHPVLDRGQNLDTPEMRAIGFVDTKEQFDAVTQALFDENIHEARLAE